jgi:hypothetical protein
MTAPHPETLLKSPTTEGGHERWSTRHHADDHQDDAEPEQRLMGPRAASELDVVVEWSRVRTRGGAEDRPLVELVDR